MGFGAGPVEPGTFSTELAAATETTSPLSNTTIMANKNQTPLK